MTAVFLTREEVRMLTGAGVKRLQIANLRKNGIRHTINAAGWPVVTRAAVEGGAESETPQQGWKPNKAA
jgi:hypothetical protein